MFDFGSCDNLYFAYTVLVKLYAWPLMKRKRGILYGKQLKCLTDRAVVQLTNEINGISPDALSMVVPAVDFFVDLKRGLCL